MTSIDDDLRMVMAAPEGRRVIFWLLSLTRIYSAGFVQGMADATAFNLGEQNVGKKLLVSLSRIDPKFYPALLLEAAERKQSADAAEDLKRRETKDEEDDDDVYA